MIATTAASWNPDGKSLVVSGISNWGQKSPIKYESFRISADGTGRELIELDEDEHIVAVSPDGTQFLRYTTAHDAENRLVKVSYRLSRSDGTDVRPTLEADGEETFQAVRFTPDGKSVAYLRINPEETCLWAVDLDGKTRRKLVLRGRRDRRPTSAGRATASGWPSPSIPAG